ncbi:MAG: hypothetical protein K0Q50_2181 [Vampirovibrio sp.]|jgi:hypothetical protein|nr:hypothetical protein [Vampirovibrio sp.]
MFPKRFIPTLLLAATLLALGSIATHSGLMVAFACSDHASNKAGTEPSKVSAEATQPAEPSEQTPENTPAPDHSQPAAQPQAIPPAESQATPLEASPMSLIQQGKLLMETRCSSCHPTPRANTHTLAEWPAVLQRMGRLAAMKDEEIQQIQLYLDDTLKPQSRADWDQPNS